MSHFTTIKTKIIEQDLLLKTLDNLKLNWHKKQILVNQFSKEKYLCDILIKQKNNQNIGFLKKTDSYELIYDEIFWNLTNTVSSFNEKISSYYALNLIIKNLSKNGFEIKNLTEQKEFDNVKIKINALRFNA
jgi:Protein of unknown function (DUF1257)